MKRYKLIDNETGNTTEYSNFEWGLAWKLVFVSGVVLGIVIGYYYL